MNYHNRIMNIRNTCQNTEKTSQVIYAHGHHDARHAAAEIAAQADAEIESLKRENAALKAENQRIKNVLSGAYTLAIGWASYYQHTHNLQAFSPIHKKILDDCQSELSHE